MVRARNDLRREAKLPILDEDAEVARGLALECQQRQRDQLARHGDLLVVHRQAALAEYERRNGGPPRTGFGWWGLDRLASERFKVQVQMQSG